MSKRVFAHGKTFPSARHLAFTVLRQIDSRGSFVNIALDQALGMGGSPSDTHSHTHLATELVYGITRRTRTLDALIQQLSGRATETQPPALRRILHIGLYQLRYLDHIPAPVAVDTTVELARHEGLPGFAGVVNGILRAYLRLDPPQLFLEGLDAVTQLGTECSYPDWLVALWLEWLGPSESRALCDWFNQPPSLDLRVNRLRVDPATVQAAFSHAGIEVTPLKTAPEALRLAEHRGAIQTFPGYAEGWWTVQDVSAQQVVHCLDPQPGEVILDCCAAPGGKTTHIAERLHHQGSVWALDRHGGRLRRVQENAERLGLSGIEIRTVDLSLPDLDPPAQGLPEWESVDRVLVDAPCSGLGTLHRHADARWRQSPTQIQGLVDLQTRILAQAARWVKPGGCLVYATCTLHPDENIGQIKTFLDHNPGWQLDPAHPPRQIWPHREDQDGFFMAKLQRCSESLGESEAGH